MKRNIYFQSPIFLLSFIVPALELFCFCLNNLMWSSLFCHLILRLTSHIPAGIGQKYSSRAQMNLNMRSINCTKYITQLFQGLCCVYNCPLFCHYFESAELQEQSACWLVLCWIDNRNISQHRETRSRYWVNLRKCVVINPFLTLNRNSTSKTCSKTGYSLGPLKGRLFKSFIFALAGFHKKINGSWEQLGSEVKKFLLK